MKPHLKIGIVGESVPRIGLGAMMALASMMGSPPIPMTREEVRAEFYDPDGVERGRKADERRKRRAARPGASNYAKKNS